MRLRKRKKTDQAHAQKAYELLLDLIENNQREIEPTLWVGVMIGALAENYENSDVPFEFFKEEISQAVEHYRY